MKVKFSIAIFFLSVFIVGVYASEQAPILVSPSSDVGIAIVGEVCPTFSWTAVERAVAYRIEIYLAKTEGRLLHDEIPSYSNPMLSKEIYGVASSWTPSWEEKLDLDRVYLWFVCGIDSDGNGNWSNGGMFKINSGKACSATADWLEDYARNVNIVDDSSSNAFKKYKNPENSILGILDDRYSWISGIEGPSNTYYGLYSGFALTSGFSNCFFGYESGRMNTEGSYNSFLGYQSGYNNTTGDFNTFLGLRCGVSNTTGDQNTFMGAYTGDKNTTGIFNTFIGSTAGRDNFSGQENTFIGTAAGLVNTTGNGNSFLGDHAGIKNTTGNYNTYIGYQAGTLNETGSYNVCIGHRAGHKEKSSNKLYIDNTDTSNPLIYGEFDNDILSFIGTVGIGTKSPAFPMEMKKTGTNASIVVDRTDGATNYINATDSFGNFGTVTNHPLRLVTNSLWRMRVNSDNSLTMRNGASCTTGGVWTNASSRDLKDDINDLTSEQALDALNDLQPVTYKYKADMDDEHLGFIAEDVPDLVASKDRKGMSPMDVVAVLTKVLQEQQKLNLEQQKVNEELRAEIAELRAKLSQVDRHW